MSANPTPRPGATLSRARRALLGVGAAAVLAALPASASAQVAVNGPYVTGASYPNCQTGTWAPHAQSNTGYYRPDTRHVHVGDVFYMAVWVIGSNNLCPSQYTNFEVAPPAGTKLAISSQHPVRCWGKLPRATTYQREWGSCPQAAYGSWFDQRIGLTWYAFKPTTQSAFPLPLNGAWQIDIPLQAVSASTSTRAWGSARTNYGALNGYVDVRIDPEPVTPLPQSDADVKPRGEISCSPRQWSC